MSEEAMINVVRAKEALRVRLGDVERERDQLRTDLEAARVEIERMKDGWTADQAKRQVADFTELCRYINKIADALGCANPHILETLDHMQTQSRATEAELRAEIEALKKRLPTPECRLDEWFSGGCPCDCHPAAKAALDAQEVRT